jgi:hypothetical protein
MLFYRSMALAKSLPASFHALPPDDKMKTARLGQRFIHYHEGSEHIFPDNYFAHISGCNLDELRVKIFFRGNSPGQHPPFLCQPLHKKVNKKKTTILNYKYWGL